MQSRDDRPVALSNGQNLAYTGLLKSREDERYQNVKEVGVSSRENPPSTSWTYRMEVSPTGQPSSPTPPNTNMNSHGDPVALLQILVTLQTQTLDVQRQILQNQAQQLELTKEATHVAREQRARQIAELERWQAGHDQVLDQCRDSLTQLEQVHSALMGELVNHVAEHHENLVEGDFALSDFVDRFGPRLAHLNTMLAVLRPLAAANRRAES